MIEFRENADLLVCLQTEPELGMEPVIGIASPLSQEHQLQLQMNRSSKSNNLKGMLCTNNGVVQKKPAFGGLNKKF